MRNFGICAWSVPLDGEELYAWLQKKEVGNISIDFDYEACKNESGRKEWVQQQKALAEKYGIDFSILAVNILCTYGMNKNEHEELVRDILEKACLTASLLGAPAIHMPSFVDGEIKSREEMDQVIIALNHACRMGEKYQVQVGYECPLNAEDLGYILDRVSGETFFVLFDNENVSLRGIDPVELYEKYKKYYIHTHVKTASALNTIRPLKEEDSFGGIARLSEAMRKSGFHGYVIIESEYWKEPDREKWEKIFDSDKEFILSNWGE